jgi:hypothetical protein
MKNSSKKKTLLGLATTLMPTGITMFIQGNQYQGAILIAMAVALMLAYDHYDDKVKVPEGIDKETFVQLSELGADGIKDLVEKYRNRDGSDSDN